MASSNRHWPSMFKSKPCNPHHQWQHDISPSHHISPCQKAPYASGSEERSPDPKPRWNPKPEQIRILEAIFNSGMVNPPRDEIRRIRVQLQEYGQVGDANVFYWFQNRKSRSKHKQRSHLHTSKTHTQSSSVAATTFVVPSSSSSSSEKSPPPKRTNNLLQMGGSGVNIIDAAANSPTASVNQTYFQSQGDFSTDPFFYPVVQQTGNNNTLFSQGLCFPELSNIVQIPDQVIVPCTGFLLSELLNQNATAKRDEEQEKLKLEQQLSYTAVTTTNSTTTTTTPNPIPSSSTCVGSININQIQGGEECGGGGGLGLQATAVMKSTVFINNVAVEVALGPFNVRDTFGEDALLIHSLSGQPVATNEWGVTLQSLQPGALYYLVCTSNIFAS